MIGGNLVERGLIGPRVVGGTWSAATAWTIPAVTLGGNITATGKEIDAAILDACVAKGTWTSSGTWTIPAVTLGGTMTLNGQVFNAGAGNAAINSTAGNRGLLITSTNDGATGSVLGLITNSASPAAADAVGRVFFQGKNSAAGDVSYGDIYCYITDPLNTNITSSLSFLLYNANSQNIAVTLSGAGALWSDLSVDTLTYKVSGTQVVGARVVDARCDDVVDSTYGAEEAGVLDALRDAMITHGLIAAA